MKKYFSLTFFSLILLEALSFLGWYYSGFGNIVLALIIAATLLVSLKDIRYGVAIMLAELIVGSHGYLFSFQETFLPTISLRIGLFTAVMLAFVWHAVKTKKIAVFKENIYKPLTVLAIVILIAAVAGVLMNGKAIAFSDANSYAYFLLVFPLFQAFTKFEDLKLLGEVAVAASLVLVLKGLSILYLFSHFITFGPWMPNIYKWVRDTRVGEITQNEQAEVFFRIFFASHIWIAIAFVMAFVFWLNHVKKQSLKELVKLKAFWLYAGYITLLFTSTLVSLSRSNWLGMVVTAVFWVGLFFVLSQSPLKKLIHSAISVLFFSAVSLLLITTIVLFPFPPTQGGFSAGDLFKSRVSNLTGGEAAIDSRKGLLPPMKAAIKEKPVLGHGFGKQLTYITEDPRIRAENPSGEYTTHAFEWGYLELWIKLGGIGLIAYLAFIFFLVSHSLKHLLAKKKQVFNDQDYWVLAFLLGGVLLLATHAFSPYLNHPLGIGYLLFWGLILTLTKQDKLPKIKAI